MYWPNDRGLIPEVKHLGFEFSVVQSLNFFIKLTKQKKEWKKVV